MVLTRAAQAKKTDTVPPPDKPTKEPARKGKRKAQDEAASKDDVAAAKPEPKKRATRKAVKPEVEEPVKPEAEELVQPMIEEPKRKATRAATRSTATTKAATKEVATKTKAPAVAAPVATTRTRTSSRTKKTEAEDKKNEQPKEKVAAKPKTTKRASAKPFTENTKSSVTKKNQDPKVETIEEKEEPQGPKSPEMFHTITVQLPSALAMKTAPPLSSKLAYTQTPVSKPVQVAQESHIPVLVDANIAEQQGEIIEDISPFKSSSVFGKRGLKFKNSLLQSSPRKMPSFTPSRLFSPGKAEIISKQGSTSLLKNSPRKPPVETSHLSSPARRNASNEADTQHRESVLAASPRRIKLASPSKLAADLFGSSSTRPNLFSSSFLKLSPMRPKYPAIVPVPSPLREPSSLGTPMRSPARRFFSPKKDVSPDRMVDETIMFGEPEFHCSVQSVVEAAVEPSTTPELEIVQESEEGITGIAQELPVDCVEETKLATELESEMAAALEAAVEGDVFAITPQKQEEELFEAPKPVQKLRFSPSKSSLKSPEKKAPESPKKTVTWDQLTVTPTAPKPADPAVNAGILAGTIFFVDVCSAEGANCNDIFSPLLFELGATVVGSWVSNVSGIGGITHVLFKDGQRRTLEKVIASNGSVKCVNIAWALDCEKFNKRVDESDYLIDLSHMLGQTTTPRPLCARSVNNTPLAHRTPGRTPLKSFTPTYSAVLKPAIAQQRTPDPFLPSLSADKENAAPAPASSPFFLDFCETPEATVRFSPDKLVQRTCPPKQSRRKLFDTEGRKTPLRAKLAAAKRRSLAPMALEGVEGFGAASLFAGESLFS